MEMGARLPVIFLQLSREVVLVNSAFQCDTFGYDVHPHRRNSTGDLWTLASQAASASTLEIDRA